MITVICLTGVVTAINLNRYNTVESEALLGSGGVPTKLCNKASDGLACGDNITGGLCSAASVASAVYKVVTKSLAVFSAANLTNRCIEAVSCLKIGANVSYVDNSGGALCNLNNIVIKSCSTGNGYLVADLSIGAGSENKKSVAICICDVEGNVVILGIPCLVDLNYSTLNDNCSALCRCKNLGNGVDAVLGNYGSLGIGLNGSIRATVTVPVTVMLSPISTLVLSLKQRSLLPASSTM